MKISKVFNKQKRIRILTTILGIFLLVGVVGIGVAATQQQQNLHSEAASQDTANCAGKCKPDKETCIQGVCKKIDNKGSDKCNCVKIGKGTDCGGGSCTNGSCTCNKGCEPKKGSSCSNAATCPDTVCDIPSSTGGAVACVSDGKKTFCCPANAVEYSFVFRRCFSVSGGDACTKGGTKTVVCVTASGKEGNRLLYCNPNGRFGNESGVGGNYEGVCK